MAKNNILYSIAMSPAGQLINADDAEKGIDYSCPLCKNPFTLRKGKKKRPHFAHKNLSPNCNPETALHYSFKNLLAQKIQEHLNNKEPLKIKWLCTECHEYHSGNLIKKAVQIKTEYDLGTCRPDIALLGQNNEPVAVIEVIVTHAPEQQALDFYEQNKIAVVPFTLKSDEDIDLLNRSILETDKLDLCTNPKCSTCGNRMARKSFLIVDGECWKCSASMKVGCLLDKNSYIQGYVETIDFAPSDIGFATEQGCYLKSHYSRTARERYVANTCRSCGAFIGEHYLSREYINNEKCRNTEHDAGFYCPECTYGED